MILTMTKYHEHLLRDSPLSLLFMVNFFSSLETKMVKKIPNETFLRITRYTLSFLFPYTVDFHSNQLQGDVDLARWNRSSLWANEEDGEAKRREGEMKIVYF